MRDELFNCFTAQQTVQTKQNKTNKQTFRNISSLSEENDNNAQQSNTSNSNGDNNSSKQQPIPAAPSERQPEVIDEPETRIDPTGDDVFTPGPPISAWEVEPEILDEPDVTEQINTESGKSLFIKSIMTFSFRGYCSG